MRLIAVLLFSAMALFANPSVAVSILPQKYFVEKIAGDTVDVEVMVLPGSSPATYEPKTSQMKALEKVDIYFSIGVPFEKTWLKRFKAQIPNLNIVATDEGIVKRSMIDEDDKHHDHDHDGDHDEHEHHSHDGDHHEHEHDGDHEHHDHDGDHEHEHHASADDHDDGDESCDPKVDDYCYCHTHDDGQVHCHSHKGLDPHVWLDPRLVIIQVQNMKNALIKAYPENKDLYEKRASEFTKELNALHLDIKNRLKDVKSNKFMVFHPSWGYFARRYGLKQISVEEQGKEPKPAQLQNLIKTAKDENIKIMFVAPQFSKKSATIIAKEAGMAVVEMDPLPEDWMKGMEEVVKNFEKYL